MKYIWLVFVVLALSGQAHAETSGQEAARACVETLRAAYADAGIRLHEENDAVYLLMGEEKILVQAGGKCPDVSPDSLSEPPLCAVFAADYPAGEGGRRPGAGFDPGRTRNRTFLKALYGSTRDEVAKNCVPVRFLGRDVLFNKRNGAADALARVAGRLEEAVRENPEIADYLFPIAGTFYWRAVRGSTLLSTHSFAIALDLNTQKGLYWRWNPRPELLERIRRSYPQAIVDAFEAEGFIWGGKWSAFDFMHFEYRPEMLEHNKRR